MFLPVKGRKDHKNDCGCKAGFLILLFAVLVLFPGQNAFAVKSAGEAVTICPEGQYLVFPFADGWIDIYRADGTWKCRVPDYIEPGPPMMLFPGKLRNIDYENGIYLNMETGEKIGPFPPEQCEAYTRGNYLVVLRNASLTLEIYDEAGNTAVRLPHTGDFFFWEIDDALYILMQDQNDVSVHRYDAQTGECVPVYGDCFRNGDVYQFEEIYSFGDNYLISGSGVNRIVSPAWEELYRGNGYVLRYTPFYQDYEYCSTAIRRTDYFVERKGEEENVICSLIDQDMHPCLSKGEEQWWDYGVETRGGSTTHMPCELLQGKICEGFLQAPQDEVPYAREGNIYYFPVSGEVIGVPLPYGYEPEYVNSSYVVAIDENWDSHLFRLDNGEEVEPPVKMRDPSFYVGENGIVLSGNPEDGSGLTSILYDKDLHETARTKSGFIYPWLNGTWYYENEIMDGIIDENGRWLLRRWNVRD